MHLETYPTFFTPRDEELSLSSSEEKPSEFDWLERKITRKQKYIYEKQSKCSVFTSFPKLYKGCVREQAPDSPFFFFLLRTGSRDDIYI